MYSRNFIYRSIYSLRSHKHLFSFILIVITAASLFIKYYGAWIWLDFDVGRELLIPVKLANGDTLYKDVIYWYGPVSVYINSLFVKLFGAKLDVLYFVGLGLTLITAFSIYLIVDKLADYYWGILAALLFISHGMIAPEGFSFVMPYSFAVSYGSTFLSAGICLLLYHFKHGRPFYLFTAIPVLAMAFAAKLEFIPVVLFASLLYSFILFYYRSFFPPVKTFTFFLLTFILGVSIWLIPSIYSGFDTFLSNIFHKEMIDYHFRNGLVYRVLRSYSPTVIWLGIKSLLIFTGFVFLFYTISQFANFKRPKHWLVAITPLIGIVTLIFNFDINLDYFTKRIYVHINILILLIILFEYYIKKTIKGNNIIIGFISIVALSVYTRQGAVYGLWQPLSFATLSLFLYKLHHMLPFFLNKIRRSYLYTAFSLTLALLVVIGVVRIPHHINQQGERITISDQGGNLIVDAERGATIKKAVKTLSNIESDKVSFGPELGWLSVLTQKIDPIRATQWWVYVEDVIITDLEKEHIEYLVFYYPNRPNFFEYKRKMDKLEQYVSNNFSLYQRYRDKISIDIYIRRE